MALTPKQRRFVEAYTGNATEAARVAGYGGNDDVLRSIGSENLAKPDIAAAIKARETVVVDGLIASRSERQAFWSSLQRNTAIDLQHRLRASELLGKSEADFTERVEHSGHVSLEQLVIGSLEPQK